MCDSTVNSIVHSFSKFTSVVGTPAESRLGTPAESRLHTSFCCLGKKQIRLDLDKLLVACVLVHYSQRVYTCCPSVACVHAKIGTYDQATPASPTTLLIPLEYLFPKGILVFTMRLRKVPGWPAPFNQQTTVRTRSGSGRCVNKPSRLDLWSVNNENSDNSNTVLPFRFVEEYMIQYTPLIVKSRGARLFLYYNRFFL